MRRSWGAKITAVVLLLGSATAYADAVSDWAEFAEALDGAGHQNDRPFDTGTFLAGTRASLAMFEAADSVDRRYVSLLDLPRAAPGASAAMAVATAAHDVLLAGYPASKAAIDDRYALALVDATPGSATNAGIAAGHAAAAAALKAGGLDTAVKIVPYWPAGRPGQWLATTPTVFDPHYTAIRPWFMASATAFRPGPPIALDSKTWRSDIDEVRRMGGKTSTERTAAETIRARFWAPYDSAPALRAVAAQPGRSLVRNARFYALAAMTIDDAALAMIEAKLHYGFWRPVQAIRAGSGGPADPSWEPLLKTPLHPEYPCGHCVIAAALATVIEAEGAPKSGLPFTNAAMPGVVVTVATPADYVAQVSFSRICGGVHFRSTVTASETMARKIAANAIAKFAAPL